MPPTTLPPLSLSLPGPRTCALRLCKCDVSERQTSIPGPELPDPRRKQPATVSGGGNGHVSVSVRVSSALRARYPLHSRLPVACVSDLAALPGTPFLSSNIVIRTLFARVVINTSRRSRLLILTISRSSQVIVVLQSRECRAREWIAGSDYVELRGKASHFTS